ncbi:MAG: TIGR00296 family protein [Promethearchaeota archaeon]
MDFSLEDGEKLVKFARQNIEYYLVHKKKMPIPKELKEKFKEKMGAFVTISRRKGEQKILRGCIGITIPYYPLIETISNISISSAFEDPRFPPIKDLSEYIVEVSILTPPKLIKVNSSEEYLEKIKIGHDGLMIETLTAKGLLLPQVPIENNRNWDVKTFLEHLCLKAWLPKSAWKNKNTKIYSFQAIIFEEEEPNGPVVRKNL